MAFGDYLQLVADFNSGDLSDWLAFDWSISGGVLRTTRDDNACLYVAQSFGPDLEVAIQLLGGLLAEIYCPHVLKDAGLYFEHGHYVQVRYGLATRLYKIDGPDNDIQIGDPITSPTFNGGDWLGIRKTGSLYEVYRATSFPTFSKIGEWIDNTDEDFPGSPGVGLAYTTDPGVDNLYVGTIPRAPTGVPELSVS